MKKLQVLFYASMLLCFEVFCQGNSTVIPPSPNAASLGKFGDIPVSYYTGIPSITIPLHTVQVGSYSFPIQLSYHASGVKVEEEASWVGLNWSLMSGGVITRSIKGLDDLGLGGYPFSPNPNTSDANYMQMVADERADSEPDIFHFNFCGRTGKFILKANSTSYEAVILNQEKIKISYSPSAGWTVITEDGVKYLFNDVEYSISYSGEAESAGSAISQLASAPIKKSSWYLTEIILPTKESIYFDYENGFNLGFSSKSRIATNQIIRIAYDSYGGATCQPWTLPQITYLASRSTFYNVNLKKIRYNNIFIDFITEDRIDIEPEFNSTKLPQRLKQVDIYYISGSSNNLIKSFDFEYSYFNESLPNVSSYEYKRLKLLKITEKNLSEIKNPYIFDYYVSPNYPNQLPSKDSFSRDYWGFFNGKNNDNIRSTYYSNKLIGKSLIPPIQINTTNGQISDSGADRNTDPELTKIGVLNKIVYPTGGTSLFDYEAHSYYNYENVTIDKSYTLYHIGPLVPNPPDWGPEKEIIDIAATTVISIDAQVYCYFWEETGGGCGLSVGHFGGIKKLHSDGTSTPEIYFNFDKPVDYKTSNFKHFDVQLSAGKYEIYTNLDYDGWITIMDVKYKSPTPDMQYVKKNVGGVRVSKITSTSDVPNSPDNVIQFLYADGILMNSKNTFHHLESTYKFCSSSQSAMAFYLTRRSWSNYPLGSGAQGNHIGYSTVTVEYGELGKNGKSVYTYYNYPEEILEVPAIPDETTVVPIENGSLRFKVDHKSIGSGLFQKVKMTENEYIEDYALTQYLPGVKVYSTSTFSALGGNPKAVYMFKNYALESKKYSLIKQIETDFDKEDDNKFIETTKEFFYENPKHLQLTSTLESVNNKKIETKYRYPADFTDTEADPIVKAMKGEKHIHNAVIEEIVSLVGTDKKVISAKFQKYEDIDGNQTDVSTSSIIKPTQIYTTELTAPKSGFLQSASSSIPSDPSYKLKQEFKYDQSSGNLLQVEEVSNNKKSYVWGYNSTLPVISGENIDKDVLATLVQNSLPNGFTSLEALLISIESLPNANWTLFNQNLRSSNKYVESYTYNPLVGMTSKTDFNGITTYYDYDDLGRLKLIKDNAGNIIKKYEYNYKVSQ